MAQQEIEMVKLVRESDVIDRTNGSELAKAFNYLFDKYVEGALEQESCEDAISREEVIDRIKREKKILYTPTGMKYLVRAIKDLPSVRPARPRGKWIANDDENPNDWHCSRCGAIVEDFEQDYHNWLYCYHCGADMQESEG